MMFGWKKETERKILKTDQNVAVLTALVHELGPVVQELREVTADQKGITTELRAIAVERARRGTDNAD